MTSLPVKQASGGLRWREALAVLEQLVVGPCHVLAVAALRLELWELQAWLLAPLPLEACSPNIWSR